MIRSLLAASALFVALPGAAQVVDPLTQSADPAERAMMREVAAAVGAQPLDLVRLDALLTRLPQPTPLRGMVQTARANELARAERTPEALRAIEEGLTLLPDHPGPMFIAVQIMTFAGAAQRAADLWLQASTVDPAIARQLNTYVAAALVGRLRDLGDSARADRLEARMGEIGFATMLAPSRSATALAQVRLDMAAGRGDVALNAVSAIGSPGDLVSLYVDRRYEALWPRIAEWGGTGLENQARRYLEDLRREWSTAGDLDSATNYARALANRRQHQTVVTLFLPLIDRPDLTAETTDIEFLTPVVAKSLARIGRTQDADALAARIGALFVGDKTGRGLNFSGSLISRAYEQERWADAAQLATTFLAEAGTLGPSVNASATLTVRAIRACALWKLGRRDEAEADFAAVVLARTVMPAQAMSSYRCREDADGAGELLLTSLAGEQQRTWALASVQPSTLASDALPSERAAFAFSERLRRDPAVVAAASKVGRILPQPIDETLPAGFDPFSAQPRTLKPGSI